MNNKHGMEGTRLYSIWVSMKARCNNPNAGNYHKYGAKGIKICSEWNDAKTFIDWAIANGYKEGLTLDRKDNNLGYNPDNCKWSTMIEQQNNRCNNLIISIFGIENTVAEWGRRLGIPRTTLRDRYKRGWRGSKLIEGSKFDIPNNSGM